MLEDALKTNKEAKIQKYLEEHPLVLKMGIGVPEWYFNYVLPQFRLGAHLRADFIVLTGQSNSYEITIVELKKPEANLYTNLGTLAKDFNMACTEIDNYRRWINDNKDESKRNLIDEIKKYDPSFEETFAWTRRLRIYSKIVIGRRANLTDEIRDRNNDMEEKGVRVISYDRLIDAEHRLLEMQSKGIDLRLFNNDYQIKNQYGVELDNKTSEEETIGSDNVLFLGEGEMEYGQYGFLKDIEAREEALAHNSDEKK